MTATSSTVSLSQHPPSPAQATPSSRKRRAWIAGSVLMAGFGFCLIALVTGLLDSSSPAATLYNTIKGKQLNGQEICARVASDDFHGAFRELDCLINYRRSLPKQGTVLNKLILKKFRKLNMRLRSESTDWRTAARWKLLYLLGTRMYPVRNRWAENAEIPVYEFNGHHMAVPFWLKEHVRGRKLGPLFHLDTHNDMRAVPSPKQVLQAVENLKKNRNVKDAWHTVSHSIYDCAMPVAGGVLTAGYRNVVWGKPSWNGYPEFVNRFFFFGRPASGTPVAVLPSTLKGAKRKKEEKRLKAEEKKRSHFRLYYDSHLDNKRNPAPNAEAWVMVDKSQRPSRKKFEMFTPFKMTILTSDLEMDSQGRGKGGAMFQRLLKAIPKGGFTLDLDLDYFASVDSTNMFKRKAGSDPEWQLDLLSKRRKFLVRNLSKFRNLLLALKHHGRVPTLITIADSTYLTFAFDSIAEGQSEYTPIEHTAFVRHEVRKMFKEIYGDKVVGREKGKAPKTTPPSGKTQQATRHRIRRDKPATRVIRLRTQEPLQRTSTPAQP